MQSRQAFATVPINPFSNGPRADAYSLRDGLRRLPALDLQYNPLSTARRQPGILMHVHPVLRWNLKLQQLSFLGQNRMTHLSRLTLFSTTAISLGGIVFLGSLTGEAISGGKETLMGTARATPAAAERTNTVLRLAQTRTEVPPTEMKAAVPAPAFADSEPPLWDGRGAVTYKVSTSSAEAQAYFDQGLRLAYAFNHGEAQRAFRKAQKLDPACAMCFWGEALVLGPNINLPMDESAALPAFAAVQQARTLAAKASPREQALIAALATRYSNDPKADRTRLDKLYAA